MFWYTQLYIWKDKNVGKRNTDRMIHVKMHNALKIKHFVTFIKILTIPFSPKVDLSILV